MHILLYSHLVTLINHVTVKSWSSTKPGRACAWQPQQSDEKLKIKGHTVESNKLFVLEKDRETPQRYPGTWTWPLELQKKNLCGISLRSCETQRSKLPALALGAITGLSSTLNCGEMTVPHLGLCWVFQLKRPRPLHSLGAATTPCLKSLCCCWRCHMTNRKENS